MSSNISFSGLASGLNTDALIQNLLRFNQQRITLLNQDVQKDTTRQTAFNGVTSRLQSLKTTANLLAQPQNSVFDTKTVSSSDSTLVTAAVGTGAQTGVTNLRVLALAENHQIASQGYDSADSTITQGSFQIQSGSASATITIDATNNTLSGLATSINRANVGVVATIINTGATEPGMQPYRLVLSSRDTGTANQIQITSSLAASSGGAIRPNFESTEIGAAVPSMSYSGTSTVTSNAGAGLYTGTANDTFTFRVTTAGTVGTDDGITLSYSNASGTQTGTLTINQGDAATPLNVVDGVQVQFSAGTLVQGDEFSVNVFAPTLQNAADAQIQLGSGTGAMVVRSASNTVTNLIPGVSIKVQSADPTRTIQLNVQNDVEAMVKQVQEFVDDYNDFARFLDQQTKYTPSADGTSGTAGPLNGTVAVRGLRAQVQQAILAIAPNLPEELNRLGAIGVGPGDAGQLKIDLPQLRRVLSGEVTGIGQQDVKALFGLQGTSTLAGIEFATGTAKTLASSTPYTVRITQAAERAAIAGTNALNSSTVIDDTNNSFSLTIDGTSTGPLTLASGTYTAAQLAAEVQSVINAVSYARGSSVTVSLDAGKLRIATDRYGSAASLVMDAGTALADLGFAGGESSTGVDVAGSYIVNGETETATGVGQILTGTASNPNTAGLTVFVSLSAAQILPEGTDGQLTVTRGIASSVGGLLEGLLDPTNGSLTLLGKQFTNQIQEAKSEVTRQTAAMSAQQTALLRQFAQLETAMANLQSQSNLLTSAFSSASTGLLG